MTDKPDLFEDDLFPEISVADEDFPLEEPYDVVVARLTQYCKKDLTYILLEKNGQLICKEIADLTPTEFTNWCISHWSSLSDTKEKMMKMTNRAERNTLFESIVGALYRVKNYWAGKNGLSTDW